MAPTRIPGQKRQREGDYSAIGKIGRKTGIAVPDLGPRDDHGLEPIDNLFSSPQKGATPARANGLYATSGSETMMVANGTPDDASSVIRSARRGTILPPKSRSPMKTNLGASPRRSMGPGSSPLQSRLSQSLNRASLSAAPRRSLNFDLADGAARASNGPRRNAGIKDTQPRQPGGGRSNARARKQMYDLLDDDVEMQEPEDTDDGEAEEQADTNGLSEYAVERESDGNLNGVDEDDSVDVEESGLRPDAFDDTPGGIGGPLIDDEQTQDDEVEEPSPEPEVQPTGRGVKRKSPDSDRARGAALQADAEKPTKKRGRPPKNKPVEAADREHTPDDRAAAPAKKTRGRKPGNRNPKARISSAMSRQRTKSHTAPASAEHGIPADASEHESQTESKKRKPKSKPMLHRQEADEEEVEKVAPTVMRSGRTSVKPLAFWRGEQIVYEPPKRIGKDLLPGGYGGIDPGRKARDADRPRTAARRKPARSKAKREYIDDDLDDDHQELWETEGETPGVLVAGVPAWDAGLQEAIDEGDEAEETYEEVELALAHTAIDKRIQWDRQRTFKFGKTLTLPFFHSGVVELPPQGEKRPKNNRKNHMVWWVLTGRVQVNVAGIDFSIGKGGMWQVPRGNLYALSNPFENTTRLFFAQASYMHQPEVQNELVLPEDEAAELTAAEGWIR